MIRRAYTHLSLYWTFIRSDLTEKRYTHTNLHSSAHFHVNWHTIHVLRHTQKQENKHTPHRKHARKGISSSILISSASKACTTTTWAFQQRDARRSSSGELFPGSKAAKYLYMFAWLFFSSFYGNCNAWRTYSAYRTVFPSMYKFLNYMMGQ